MTKIEELEKEIILRQNAIKICKQPELEKVLKDNLILVQDELVALLKEKPKSIMDEPTIHVTERDNGVH